MCFSSAGVQPGRDREQEGSRVEEKGGRTGHREADLRRLLASGELSLLTAAPRVCLSERSETLSASILLTITKKCLQ